LWNAGGARTIVETADRKRGGRQKKISRLSPECIRILQDTESLITPASYHPKNIVSHILIQTSKHFDTPDSYRHPIVYSQWLEPLTIRAG
jgi:hypothetical protein